MFGIVSFTKVLNAFGIVSVKKLIMLLTNPCIVSAALLNTSGIVSVKNVLTLSNAPRIVSGSLLKISDTLSKNS